MKRIDPCAAIIKERNDLQTQSEACHRVLDEAGIDPNPDLCERIKTALDKSTFGGRSYDDLMAKLRRLIDGEDTHGNA